MEEVSECLFLYSVIFIMALMFVVIVYVFNMYLQLFFVIYVFYYVGKECYGRCQAG